ncbi:MAG: ferredoxin-thioredoxin reductase catalytic domain-containing protein [Candidatus Diapherotrites archaeon]
MPKKIGKAQSEKAEALKKNSALYAGRAGFRLNPDNKITDMIITGLLKNEEKHGARYCPCRPLVGDKAEDVKKICPCFWHKAEIEKDGHCKCNLFVRK